MRGWTKSMWSPDFKFRDRLKELLTVQEGYKKFPYRCTAGKMTIGVGHNLEDTPLSDPVIELLLDEDLSRAIADARGLFKQWEKFPQDVQTALVLMAFQLGKTRLAAFVKTRELLDALAFDSAADEALKSEWAKQTPERAKFVTDMIRGAK